MAAGETIIIGGTGSILGTMSAVGKAYEQRNPGVRVRVLPSLGSGGGIDAVAKGAITIGVASRPLTADEKSLGISASDFAQSPFVFVAQRSIEDADLTLSEIARIYKEEKAAWSNGKRIRIIMRPASDSATTILRSMSAEMREAIDAAMLRKGMVYAVSDQESIRMVEKTPGAFGVSPLNIIMYERRNVRIFSVDARTPGIASLLAKKYPYAVTYAAVVKNDADRETLRFLRFLSSPEGKGILKKYGNLPEPPRLREPQ